ncbi:zeta toxin family protein [Streptomyces sp. NBC_01298]|uniref:zeta toxin family protein n=1 Tax=Streptomyces sp. NBC_01298 TaxID=2903817 RepID=UPI002E1060CC|nr:zeta toxin family protein [Streptomyces sp. NBC_01298]
MNAADTAVSGLPGEERRAVLEQVILPEATRGAMAQERPVVVVVAGQPGAGKTHIADLVQRTLDGRGGAVRVCRDLYKPLHRRYAEALATDVRTAGAAIRPDTAAWQEAVEEYVRLQGFNAVVESSLTDPDEFRTSSAAYRASRARIEIVAVAVAEAWSQLGTLDRFLVGGGVRYVSRDNHDRCAAQMLVTLAVIEAEQLADRVTVVRRDGTVLYDNELVEGAWRRRPAAERVVVRERSRSWSVGETAVFDRALASAERHPIYRALAEHHRTQSYLDAVEMAHADFAALRRRSATPTATT